MKRNRKIIVLSSIIALVIGVTAGSYAWFTGQAQSEVNTFKAGTLGIDGSSYEKWADVELKNMQPGGEPKTYSFTISNLNGTTPSTLDLLYKNEILDNIADDTYSLLNAAKYDIEISGTNELDKQNGISYEELKNILAIERRFLGGSLASDTYTITITLPGLETDNKYQNKEGSFTIITKAKQAIEGAQYQN